MPYHFLFFILERIMPEKGIITIETVEQLEKITNIKIPDGERQDLQKVIDTYPVRFSMHTIRQMRLSKAIQYQYLPFVDELNTEGFVNTWVGQFHQGPLEQMYQNRPIFVLNMGCPTYCRFCFRKHKECRNQPSPTVQNVKDQFKHIQRQPKIKEMLLTGGDPFMNRATLEEAVDGSLNVNHLRTLRIATRSISYYPNLFYENDKFWLEYLKRTNIRLQQKGKKLEIATHFLHPDEISFESLNIISELVNNGIPVYVQTPFLKGCNDKGYELEKLYNLLRGAGAEIHYIFMPCTPLKGNRRYVSTISSALNVGRYLSANVSDRALPKMCTATAIGKIDWFTSGWAVKPQGDDFIWLRTPYTKEYFEEFCSDFNLEAFETYKAKENSEGTIDITFRVKPGEEDIFMGERKKRKEDFYFDSDKLKNIQKKFLEDQRNTRSVFSCPKGIFRRHKTRVEIDLDEEIDFDYIANDKQITDVIISSRKDPIDNISRLESFIKKISNFEHVFSVRVRSLKLNYSPEEYSFTLINRLGEFNIISAVTPTRLEIETQFLHPLEAKEEHKELVRRLGKKGISVYNNTPIIKNVNNRGEEMEKISKHLRYCGMEFNEVYINNLEVITMNNLINMASHLRKYGSGRELPRYFLNTNLGEVNFGIDTMFFREDNQVFAKLLSYNLELLKKIDKEFEWENVIGEYPVVKIQGLEFEDDFMLKSKK